MEQYIKKSILVVEIEKRKHRNVLNEGAFEEDIDILFFIDTLETKEVDLEKELDSMITPELKFHKALPSLFDVAKHFYKLGLSNQLTWKDIKLISEISDDFMNSEDSDNLNNEEYYTEILNRFKAQKGKEV